jgi:hypothetical protein
MLLICRIREGITQIMDKYYSSEPRRPMVLPVEWRNCLKLDDSASEVITLPRMQSMRHALNSIAMDIMYYQSPLYRTEVSALIYHNGVAREGTLGGFDDASERGFPLPFMPKIGKNYKGPLPYVFAKNFDKKHKKGPR